MWVCWFFAAVMKIWCCIYMEFGVVCTHGITLILSIKLFPFNRFENSYEIEQKCVKISIWLFQNKIKFQSQKIELNFIRKSTTQMFENFMAATATLSKCHTTYILNGIQKHVVLKVVSVHCTAFILFGSYSRTHVHSLLPHANLILKYFQFCSGQPSLNRKSHFSTVD